MTRADVEAAAGAVLTEIDPRDLRGIRLAVVDRPGPLEVDRRGIAATAEGACLQLRRPWWNPWARRAIVVLYAENLPTSVDVRRVLLHELCHAHGLDEDAVAGLGLQT